MLSERSPEPRTASDRAPSGVRSAAEQRLSDCVLNHPYTVELPMRSFRARLALLILPMLLSACATSLPSEESVASTESALVTTENACVPQQLDELLKWSTPNARDEACDGVWSYFRYNQCSVTSSLCGMQCPAYSSCRNWSFGRDSVDQKITRTKGMMLIPRKCTKRCVRKVLGICVDYEQTCQVDSTFARNKCAELAEDYRSFYYNHGNYIGSYVESTWVTNYEAQNDTYKATCNYRLSVPQANQRVDSLCGCASSYVPRTCLLYHEQCGKYRVTTDLGQTYAQADALVGTHPGDLSWDEIEGLSGADLVCTTCESLPLPATVTSAGAAEQVRAKFECLVNRHALAPASASPFTYRNLLLLYERWGALLLPEQRAALRQLYHGFSSLPDVNACGPDLNVPTIPSSCPGSDAGHLLSELRRCERLTANHVSDAMRSLELASCTAVLDLLSGSPQCQGGDYAGLMADAVAQLLEAQLPLLSADPSGLGTLSRQLSLINAWYRSATAAAARPSDETLERVLTVFRLELEEHHGSLDVLQPALGASADVIQTALGTAELNARALDQNLLTVLFTPSGGVLPLSSVPLAYVAGDALISLGKRLDDLASYHDFACSFRECSPSTVDTPVLYGFRALAAMDDQARFSAALSSSSAHALNGYRTILQLMLASHAKLAQALQDPYAAQTSLVRLLANAKARYGNFEQEGRFRGMKSDLLHAGLTASERESVIAVVRQQAALLRSTTDQYDSTLQGLFSSVMGQIDAASSEARAQGEIELMAKQVDDLGRDLAGLQQNTAAHEQRFSRSMIEHSIRDQMSETSFFQLGEAQRFDLNGRSGMYNFSTDPNHTFAVSDIDVGAVPNLAAGQMLLIETSGEYAPTCALRRLSGNILPPRGSSPVAVNLAGAYTGPEGFTVTFSNGSYNAESSSSSETTTAGFKTEMCAGGSAPGISAQSCAYVGKEWSWSDSETDGEETRTSASFMAGLRLKTTPFPNHAAGALLIVLTHPTTGAIQDVRAVHSPQTAIFLPAATTAYLVVNDEHNPSLCANGDTSRTLVVKATPMVSGSGAAQLLSQAMSAVLAHVRARQTQFLAQGRILPAELEEIRIAAINSLSGTLDIESLPPVLLDIFQEFLMAEIANVQRHVEILTVERQRNLLLTQIRSFHKVLVNTQANLHLARQLPQRLLRRLSARVLEQNISSLQTVVEEYLEPVLELWYPRVFELYGNAPQIYSLLNLGLDSGLEDAALGVHQLVEGALQTLAVAQLGYKGSGSTLPLVAVSFVKPGTEEFHPITGQRQLSNLRKADEGRAADLWDAIEGRTSAQIQIRPEDIYGFGANRTDFTLSCAEHVPVVYKLAGYFSGYAEDIDGELNALSRSFDAFPSSGQPYAGERGLLPYQLVNDVWQRMEVPILYGTFTNIVPVFHEDFDVAAQRPVGLSPFGQFELDFAGFEGIENNGGVTGLTGKVEFILLMQVDSRPEGHNLPWVSTCY